MLQAFNADLVAGGRATKQRWAWFSAARRRDDELGTRLGTLNYLPLEIRRVIYDYIVQYYHLHIDVREDISTWLYVDRQRWIEDAWYFNLGYTERRNTRGDPSIWEYNSYWSPYPPGTLATFRLTSPTVKEEYEYWFLRTRQFAFETSFAYHGFMKQLTVEQQGWIRSLQIEIMAESTRALLSDTEADQAWMNICDELPTTLQVVNLFLDRRCRLALPGNFSRGFRRGRREIRNVARAAEMLSTLRKRILRRIPGVETHFGGWQYDIMIQEDKATLLRAWEEDVDLPETRLPISLKQERV